VQNVSSKEYAEHEEARMEKNAWKVAVDVWRFLSPTWALQFTITQVNKTQCTTINKKVLIL
jgi:hypothetical protein